MTKYERKLWYDFLRHLPVTVNRQKVIGNYIVDFYCASVKVAIELDGSQHYKPDAMEDDEKRTQFLQGLGIKVIRYSNYDLSRNFDGICKDILKHFGIRELYR